MKWVSSLSEEQSLEKAVQECASKVVEEMAGSSIHLAVAFVSAHYSYEYEKLPQFVYNSLGATRLFGCSAGGIIGNGREIENRPGFSLTVAHLPGVEIEPFHIEGDALPDMDASPDAWHEATGVPAENNPSFLLLADPFTFPAPELLIGLDYAYPQSVKIGGLASAGHGRGGNALYLGDQTHSSGAIGLGMHGNIVVDTIVAQGCRPIGRPMHISSCRDNILLGLDGEQPLKVLQDLHTSLNDHDQGLMRNSLFLGVVMDELQENPVHGDFLIRNLIGSDSQSGALAIGETLREGQIVQFHLRDSEASREDLTAVLSRHVENTRASSSYGALMFSCLGRGQYLYGRPDHDTDLFREKVGSVPLAGFFCNGEIGPVGGTTFLHGYTSSFGLFRPMRG